MNTVPSGSFPSIFLVNWATNPVTIPLTYQPVPLIGEKIRQQSNFFPLAFVAKEPPLLPRRS